MVCCSRVLPGLTCNSTYRTSYDLRWVLRGLRHHCGPGPCGTLPRRRSTRLKAVQRSGCRCLSHCLLVLFWQDVRSSAHLVRHGQRWHSGALAGDQSHEHQGSHARPFPWAFSSGYHWRRPSYSLQLRNGFRSVMQGRASRLLGKQIRSPLFLGCQDQPNHSGNHTSEPLDQLTDVLKVRFSKIESLSNSKKKMSFS